MIYVEREVEGRKRDKDLGVISIEMMFNR